MLFDWLECTPSERAARLAYLLALGRRMTTAEVAEALGCSERQARKLLNGLSRVLPLTCIKGHWQLLRWEDNS
ncbi:MAG: hypothetical protein NZ765_07480 [Anaerolineae bacterium]|nr:hypothetical protein [Anaerolineae bacterium]